MWRRTARADPAARAARAVTLAATAVFVLVACRWRPWDLFDRGGFTADFYDEQARSFLHGRLWVDPAVAGIEGFVVDGRTYLYYGPLLALVRMPVAAVDLVLDGALAGRLARLSMVVAFVALCTAAQRLHRATCAWFGLAPTPWREGLLVAAVAASPAVFLAGWVSVYHETELWAAAFAVGAAGAAIRFALEPSLRTAWWVAAAVAAATLTRASVGIGVALGACLVAVLVARRDRPHRRPAAVVVGGAGLAVAVHVAVNLARFGTLLDLPAGRQVLTLQDPSRAAWFAGNGGSFFSPRFLPTTLAQYLRPDALRVERLVPFVRFGPPAPDYASYPTETTTPAGSLTTSATLLAAAAVIGIVIVARRRSWPLAALTAGGVVAAIPSFTIGFVAHRYLVDVLTALAVPAAVTASCWRPRRIGRRPLLVTGAALAAWGLGSNVALATWTQNLKEPGFTAWRYQVDDVLFGDPAPGIVLLPATGPAPPPARDGIVGLVADCSGVYVGEQERWAVLERGEGARQLTGVLRLGGDLRTEGDSATVATGDGWQLVAALHPDDAELELRLEREGRDPLAGRVGWDGDAAVPVHVVVDPTVPELSVSVRGDVALFSFDVPPPPVRPTAAIEPGSAGAPRERLCRQLLARR